MPHTHIHIILTPVSDVRESIVVLIERMNKSFHLSKFHLWNTVILIIILSFIHERVGMIIIITGRGYNNSKKQQI